MYAQKTFYYLLDSAYGSNLFSVNNGYKYLYLDKFTDKEYEYFKKLLKICMSHKNIEYTKEQFADIIDKIFMISFDLDNNEKIDNIMSCDNCHSISFDDTLAEPEKMVELHAHEVKHSKWEKSS